MRRNGIYGSSEAPKAACQRVYSLFAFALLYLLLMVIDGFALIGESFERRVNMVCHELSKLFGCVATAEHARSVG